MRPLARSLILAAMASAGPLLAGSALADGAAPATLAGHAVLPAFTIIAAPADAPADLKVSGKYTAADGRRVDAVGSIPGVTSLSNKEAPRLTGLATPFAGQPVQGFSGIKAIGDGSYWVLTDNGFGAKANSPDAMLMIHRVRPDWVAGTVALEKTIFLSDSDKKVPFHVMTESTDRRYLTGADFDIESIQPVAGGFWLGDEFGPYLLKLDGDGRVEAVFETLVDGKPVRSPDHFAVTTPGAPNGKLAFNAKRSKGFEGMAMSPDGTRLYALLEGPLWTEEGAFETVDGKEVLRIAEFDVTKEAWTGRSWQYPLEANGNAIGDFNMIDATTGMIIERDNGEGAAAKACAGDDKGPDCFPTPARMKRIYKIALPEEGGLVRKVAYIDLLAIADPDHKARTGAKDGTLDFPFVTIEDVDVVDPTHIIVANDNNLPFSAGRSTQAADDNEFMLLAVPEFLAAH